MRLVNNSTAVSNTSELVLQDRISQIFMATRRWRLNTEDIVRCL